MFWKKSQSASQPPASPSGRPRVESIPVGVDDELDRALDTIGAMVRSFGQYAFDTDRASADQVRDECDELIRHLLLGPARKEREDEDAPPPSIARRRDWGTVHRYVDNHRRHESAFVHASLGNLRQAVQAFAQCLSVAVADDKKSDKKIDEQLGRLVTTLETDDPSAIRREANRVVTVVRSTMDRRRAREKEQLVQLGRRVQTLREELDIAREKATLDGLTGLYNRAAFDEELQKVADLGLLLGSEPTLVMIDIDHFKLINDRYGHPAGDAVLKVVSDCLVRHFLRKVDFVARYGGEEFAVVVRDSTLEKVVARADRVRQSIADQPLEVADAQIAVTISLGAAAFVPGEPSDSWITRADRALYVSKQSGRNRIEIADSEAPPAPDPNY